MFDKEMWALITSARILGDPPLKIFLEDGELLRLCAVAAADVGQGQLVSDYIASEEVEKGYYAVPLSWFKEPVLGVSFEQKYLELRDAIPDFTTYFKNLCALHKRRLKFQLNPGTSATATNGTDCSSLST